MIDFCKRRKKGHQYSYFYTKPYFKSWNKHTLANQILPEEAVSDGQSHPFWTLINAYSV